MKISEAKVFDDSTIMNQVHLLTKNINYPYGKVAVDRTKESLEPEEIVRKIKSIDTFYRKHYIDAVCDHLLQQRKNKEEANTVTDGIIRRLVTLFEQKTGDSMRENELLKKENVLLKESLKLVKEEHQFLKEKVVDVFSDIQRRLQPIEEKEEQQKRRF